MLIFSLFKMAGFQSEKIAGGSSVDVHINNSSVYLFLPRISCINSEAAFVPQGVKRPICRAIIQTALLN